MALCNALRQVFLWPLPLAPPLAGAKDLERPPIFVNETVIGAIGAAGARGVGFDEACARAGIDKIRDRLK